MSLTTTTATQQFTVTAVPQPALSVTFKAINTTDLVVVCTNSVTKVDLTLINNSDYTVTQLNNNSGCVVTLEATGLHYAINDTITVSRVNPETQPTVFSGTTDMTGLEASLDWIVMQVQALQDKTDRSLRIPRSNVSTLTAEMAYNDRLTAFPYFDSNGNLTLMTLATLTTTILGGSTTVTKNTVYAGPTSGASAAPTFRTLVVADFNGGTGASASTFWCGDGTWKSASSGALSATGTPTNGQFAQWTNATTLQGVTLIPVASGGTNLASYTTGDILYASGATTIGKLADVATGSVLVSGGVGTAPAYSATPNITTRLSIGGAVTAAAFAVQASVTASAGVAYNANLTSALTAAANSDNLYGLYITNSIATVTFTTLNVYGVSCPGVPSTSGTGSIANFYAFHVPDLTTASGTNKYAFYSAGVGLVKIGSVIDSTTTATGSIVTAGGIGCAKNISTLTLNGNTFTTGTYTLTGTAAKTLNFTNTLTLSGTDSTTMTFPSASTTVAGLSVSNTFTNFNWFQCAARTGSASPYIQINLPADTAITASTEASGLLTVTATRQWATGALALQREYNFVAPTYGFVGASTVTDAATLGVSGAPFGGTNATLTNAHGILVRTSVLTNTTNGYGLTVNAPTGATTNWAAQFLGAVSIDKGSANGAILSSIPANTFIFGSADATANNFIGVSYGNNGAVLMGYGIGGTRASPSATTSGQILVGLQARGFDTALVGGAPALYTISANSLWSGSNHETQHKWTGVPNASITAATQMTLDAALGLVVAVSNITCSAGNLIFSTTGKGWTGTATNDNASAGNVGEFISQTINTGSSVSLSTGTTATVTSVSFTAGDWDVWGVVDYTAGASTSITNMRQGISTTAATLGSQDTYTSVSLAAEVPTAAFDAALNTPHVRLSLGSTTTVYLVANCTFTVSTLKAYGSIFGRRRR